MAQFLRSEKDIEQELILESSSEEAIPSESDNGRNKDAATEGCVNNVSGCHVHIWSRPQPLELWWWPSFHWKSQWIEDTKGISCE